MAKRKGIIQVAEEELAKVQGMVDTNYKMAKDLRKKANQLRENSPQDFKSIKEAAELIEEAKHYESIAEGLIGTEVHVANRSLDEKSEYVRKFKVNVGVLEANLVTVKRGLEELKLKHRKELEQQGLDIDNASWSLQQAQLELDKLEGN